MNLAPSDTQRLVKLLGMLGSDHAGERAAAGLKAHKFLVEREVAWSDVIAPAQLPPPSVRSSARSGQARAAFLLECGFEWNDWEDKFLESIARWRGPLTPKQSARLRDLDEKAQAWLQKETVQ